MYGAINRQSTIDNRQSSIILKLVGANPAANVVGLDPLPGKTNYFIGNDPTKWRTNVPNYAKVKYEHVYPGVDLVYYGNQRQLEYDFVVAPSANPKAIQLEIGGARKLEVDSKGDLVIAWEDGGIRMRKPVVYQWAKADRPQRPDTTSRRQFLDGRYVLKGDREVSFEVAAYDSTRPFVIDPSVVEDHIAGLLQLFGRQQRRWRYRHRGGRFWKLLCRRRYGFY